MTDQEFSRLCTLHGFGEFASTIRSYVLPCIGFSTTGSAGLNASSSKFGGDPALPKSFEWPTYKGRPLDFLLQINLREAAKHDSARLLPTEGSLAFFYELEEQPWGYDPKNLSFFKVSYFP
jgi:uncharacterized protein YwqG